MKRIIGVAVCVMMLLSHAGAEENIWTLVTQAGKKVAVICYEPEAGDQYISGDNILYEVKAVQGKQVIVKKMRAIALPDVSWLDEGEQVQQVSALGEKRIALYCTHSDESYEPSDGLYSDDQRGSIYQIARALASAMEERGVQAEVSDTLHHPHDAGAYRRSRQTAVQLLKALPDALLDIHRDGIPDPDEYAVTIGAKEASKIRLLVGRGNQNMEANKEFALLIKAVADRLYPGLIKDIYMGKGAFNQDLYPRSLLLECGTYTLSKERVLTTMPLMAEVLYRAMYGGVTGSAGVSDVNGVNRSVQGGETQGQLDPLPAQEDNHGAGSGVLLAVGGLAIGLVLFGVLAKGNMKDGLHKAGRNLSEMTGGLIGKKPDKDQEEQ